MEQHLMGQLRGKVALITGSASGIGEATARLFAAEGARVVINSVSSVADGTAVAASLPDAIYVQADVSDDDQARALVAATVERYGQLDVVVNNAGFTKVIPHADLEAVTDELFRRILDVNVLGTWHVSRAAVPALKATGAGCIVNVTSLAGVKAAGSSIPYAVSKAALNHLTILMANVLGPEIRVNAVAPGLVDTPWTEDWDEVRKAVTAMAPLKRSGQPQDCAHACLFLATAAYCTGDVLLVDGGMHVR